MKAFLLSVLLIVLISCDVTEVYPPPHKGSPIRYIYQVIQSLPHDTQAFTEGLVYENGYFYEGTGYWGYSNIRKVDPQNGNILMQRDLSSQYFGEGVTLFNGKIYQLTWKSHTGFIYSEAAFDSLGSFSYDTEGWGLTHDDNNLIMSDGTSAIRFLDPGTFEVVKTINVVDNGEPVARLNELEYIDGMIYANIWYSNEIAIINPDDGTITGWVDLTGLLPDSLRTSHTDVLNGIAWNGIAKRIFVTGKYWPRLYEIELVEE